MHKHRQSSIRRGFTLIEAAIVTVIVGVGIVAMLQLMAAGTMANAESTKLTTAMGLVSNIHERALGVQYDQLLTTFNNKTWSPPIDAKGAVINAMNNWSQVVDFQYVDPNAIKNAVPDTQVEGTGRMTVTIIHNNQNVYTTSWLVAASEWP
jgi:prepilin-type N-terminal cleavage/methylation domain-containing protein